MRLSHAGYTWTQVRFVLYSLGIKFLILFSLPGETVDKPLVYEAGWGKKLTYVIAFSKDEVQDVTWRYSKDHHETRKRRQLVRPRWLVKTILELTKTRMTRCSEDQSRMLTERRLAECLEMLTPRTVTQGDQV